MGAAMKRDRITSYTLRNAAKMMEEAHHSGDRSFQNVLCCTAISIASRNNSHAYYKAKGYLSEWFKPEGVDIYWFGDPGMRKNTEVRIMLLYLAAHMAYSEGL